MYDLALLAIQLCCVIVQVRVVAALLESAAADESRAVGLRDVTLPLALFIPCIAAMARGGSELGGLEIAAMGTPVAIAGLGVGVAILRSATDTVRGAQLVLVCGSGVILVLLAFLDRLMIGVGQTAFAAGAVLLWFNTPHEKLAPTEKKTIAHTAGYSPVLFITVLTQAVIIVVVSDSMRVIALGLAVLCAVVTMLVAAWMLRGGLLIALWTAVYGVLFGIGLLSISRVLGASGLLGSRDSSETYLQISYSVSKGFSALALEGATLIGLPLLLLAASLADRTMQRILGGGLLILAIALLANRLFAIG